MRVLAVADTTENWTNETFDTVRDVDMILSLGDMYSIDLERLRGVSDTPILGVYGNHCSRGYLEQYGVDLSNRSVAAVHKIGDVTILGVSGCVRYSNAAYHQWTQEEYTAALAGAPACDWVVTHCPPRGCNDHDDNAHQGIDALREYVIRHKPSHLFHGHTYPENPQTMLGITAVHYVRGWDVIEV